MEIFKNKVGYEPLLVNCEGYWDMPLSQLPTALKSLVSNNYTMFPWDMLNERERRNNAAQIDSRQNPELEPSTNYMLAQLEEGLRESILTARRESNAEKVLALQDIAEQVRKILFLDRDRVGTEIQNLKKAGSQAQAITQNAPAADKPLRKRERDSLLIIIAILCKDVGYEYGKVSKTTSLIKNTAVKLGIRIGDTTIDEVLKKIPDALETRMKQGLNG